MSNNDFEATVEVDRNDVEDDTLGIYGPQAQMAGVAAKELPDELIYGVVTDSRLTSDTAWFLVLS